jgi:mono/diheme cytochrome c family protein
VGLVDGRPAARIPADAGVAANGSLDSLVADAAPSALDAAAPPPEPTRVTFYRDVLPILRARCQSCHGPEGVGPFPLGTYEDARAQHPLIATVVAAGKMPPWLPAPGCQPVKGERAMTKAEVIAITTWSKDDAPAGDEADAPAVAPAPRSELRWVDQTLDIGAEYQPQPSAGPLDDWRCFVIDPKLTQARQLLGYEITPTLRAQVHHGTLVEADATAAAARDAADPGPGWTCIGGVGIDRSGVIGTWASGFGVVDLPEGTGLPIAAGRVLVLQLHYHMHAAAAAHLDRTRLRLQFARDSGAKLASIVTVSEYSVRIPAGAIGHMQGASASLPAASTIWGAQPHMHKLGRRIHLDVTTGTGAACLLDVPRWDYLQEDFFFFERPLQVPAGSQLKVTCVWDNPGARTVGFGFELDDEMCDAALYVTSP